MAGISRLQMEAATITPAANPVRDFCCVKTVSIIWRHFPMLGSVFCFIKVEWYFVEVCTESVSRSYLSDKRGEVGGQLIYLETGRIV